VVADPAFLMIADIAGYTRFMKLHRMSLAHSQVITGRLLAAVVKAAPKLRLIEIEGDAAFLYSSQVDNVEASAADLSLLMLDAFHAEQDRMIALNMCSCDGCVQAGKLKIKFVAHIGEVAMQTIGRRTQLVGVEVIAVHRMLKNSVPVDEYLLMSEPVYERCSPDVRALATSIDEDLEGLDVATLQFVDLNELAPQRPPPPETTKRRRLAETLGIACRGVPSMLTPRRPRA
jgi:hypothetical protein